MPRNAVVRSFGVRKVWDWIGQTTGFCTCRPCRATEVERSNELGNLYRLGAGILAHGLVEEHWSRGPMIRAADTLNLSAGVPRFVLGAVMKPKSIRTDAGGQHLD